MLSKLKKSKSEGFTIIEVMIVLAIAGLILLIVFLAVPALQRNARNTQRKNDAASYGSAVSEDTNNNSGTVPTAQGNAVTDAGKKAGQLTTVSYQANGSAFQALANPMVVGTVYISQYATCAAGSGGQIGTTGGTIHNVAVSYLIESPGASATGNAPAGYVSQCVTAQ